MKKSTNNMTEIGNKILAVIKEKKLHPTSKFIFSLKSYLWTFFTVLMVVFGSLAVSVIIFYLKNEDWELYKQAGFSQMNFLLLSIPYFWILLSLLFILLAYYNFHHTKFGYRYRFSLVIASYFALSIVIGSITYVFGAGDKIEGLFFNNNLIFYGQIMEKKQEMWHRPEMGFVVGQIILIDMKNNQIDIIDPMQEKWFVDVSDTRIPPFIKFEPSSKIRVIGKIFSGNRIKADIIKPFFIEPLELCNNEVNDETESEEDCILIHRSRSMMKGNFQHLRIIN